jgi:hypothetical protein
VTGTGRIRIAIEVAVAMPSRGRSLMAIGVGLASASVLIFEIVLTRVFAVTQFYHFAFATVSLALLGFGASGSVLAAFPRLGRGGPRRWALLAAGQAVSTVGAFVITNALPFDSFSIAWDRRQIGYLAAYYLVLGVPFLFGGAVIGVLLAGWDQPEPVTARGVYAASLVGSGIGSVLALGALAPLGGVGVVMLAALCGLLGSFAFLWIDPDRSAVAVLVVGAAALLLAVGAVRPPALLDLRISPYKDLSAALRYPDAETLAVGWTAAARVDHIRSEGIRSLPGLSTAYAGSPPPQEGVTFDGDNLSAIPLVGAEQAQFAPYLLSSLPFSLRPGGDVLVLEPRGGLDVLTALSSGAGSVVAVEPNRLALEAARSAGTVYDDPRVSLTIEEPRAFVEATDQTYDVIWLSLTAPYRPVTSGAYSLTEDYRLTVEALGSYLSRLRPGGLFATMRWLQTPPSEEVRLVALAGEALRRRGVAPSSGVVALRGYASALVIVKPEGFTTGELTRVRAFARQRRFDLFAAPGLTEADANRYNVLPSDDYYRIAASVLTADDPARTFDSYAFDITPPTDDRPFFGHFFKWSQAAEVWAGLGRTWQPFGGAGYFVIVALGVLALILAAGLILLPLALRVRLRRRPASRVRSWTVAYFGLLGIGFLFVEIPIFQQYILLLGRPTVSLAVVLSVLLIASGVGSLLSEQVPWRAGAIALTAALVAYPSILRVLTGALLSAPLWARIAVGGLALAPLGFLMGIMFPRGIGYLRARAGEFVPWAWGINGAASVVSAAAAALLALAFGFSVVVLLGAASYGVCAVLARPPGGQPEPT